MKTTEEWRDIPSMPGFQASSLGRIRGEYNVPMPNGGSRKRTFGPSYGVRVTTTGQIPFRMQIVSRRKTKRVHRLICEAFHGSPGEGEEVMHLNECPIDNRPDNLRWGTRKENLNHPKIKSYHRRVCKEKMMGLSPT